MTATTKMEIVMNQSDPRYNPANPFMSAGREEDSVSSSSKTKLTAPPPKVGTTTQFNHFDKKVFHQLMSRVSELEATVSHLVDRIEKIQVQVAGPQGRPMPVPIPPSSKSIRVDAADGNSSTTTTTNTTLAEDDDAMDADAASKSTKTSGTAQRPTAEEEKREEGAEYHLDFEDSSADDEVTFFESIWKADAIVPVTTTTNDPALSMDTTAGEFVPAKGQPATTSSSRVTAPPSTRSMIRTSQYKQYDSVKGMPTPPAQSPSRPAPSKAASKPLMVIEPKTGMAYPATHRDYDLIGFGPTIKGKAWIVYVVALYGGPKILAAAQDPATKSSADAAAALHDVASRETVSFCITMNITTNTKRLATAIEQAVKPRIPGLKKENKRGRAVYENYQPLTEFTNLIRGGFEPKNVAHKGSRIELLLLADDKPTEKPACLLLLQGKVIGQVKDFKLRQALVDVYLDHKATSPHLKASCLTPQKK